MANIESVPTIIWVASSTSRNENEVLAIVTDAMDGYDRREYAPDIQAGRLNEVAREEWENVWLQGDGVFFTPEEAREYADDEFKRGNHIKIVEVSIEDVADALWYAFGEEP